MLIIAVTGATGAQGGATARALLGAGHQVRALTRRPGAPAAEALRGLGVEVRHADFDDPGSLTAALAGADALFAVTTPFGTDTRTEIRQGTALVDAAAGARLGHVVLTSAAHADRGTGVPHFESKWAVEQHLRASGLPWTVIAPAAFMDNYTSGWTLDALRNGVFAWPMPADRPLTLIPATDIGAFAALALQRRDDFAGHRVDIASDTCTPAQIAATLTTALARPVTHEQPPLGQVRTHSPDLAAMFAYFTDTGLDVDVTGLRHAHPEIAWHTFADWAGEQNWAALLGRQP
ncbi:NmrA/HSCARG family protein [Streptomyces sp. MC1]|uniref:NmrA/HSCARG family protein n=1 Tax=Streptomyces flaveolus TaxID=67297 RepID=A0ABV3A6X8_9ACTN|nr:MULTISPECIES: NmrA/HSCARG family protein [Streptomyces]KOG62439.1 NmrA family protein [Streptomyces antibioticus]MBG7701126.1 NmrA/HSCARG family protein [Streptomyces sp. MC1]